MCSGRLLCSTACDELPEPPPAIYTSRPTNPRTRPQTSTLLITERFSLTPSCSLHLQGELAVAARLWGVRMRKRKAERRSSQGVIEGNIGCRELLRHSTMIC